MYILVQVFSKVAILLLFWRIFVDKRFRLMVWFCVGFLTTHGLVFLFLVIFQCDPIRSVWDKTVPATCMKLKAISAAGAILAIVEDLVILALPIREVFKLQLTFKKKVAVCFIFSVGSLWVDFSLYLAHAFPEDYADLIYMQCLCRKHGPPQVRGDVQKYRRLYLYVPHPTPGFATGSSLTNLQGTTWTSSSGV